MIDLVNVRKSFGDLEVLKDINLHIHEKEIYGIIGQSGAGKSTLLRCINGLETYESGTITVDGTTVNVKDKQQLRQLRKDMGMIFQNFNLLSRLDVYDNVALPLSFWGESPKTPENKQKIEHLIELVGLKDKMHERPSNLSGGQKQRVAIARALVNDPKILLCDEATSALDPTTTKAILALLKEINQKYGITIVIITHEMAVVQEIGTHVAIIDHGELAESGTVEEVFTHPKSKAARKLVLMDDDNHYDEMKGQHCIRIVFKSNSSFEPVIANMVLAHRMPVNILLADTKDINGVAHGQMILQLPEDTTVAQKMIQYLKDRNLEVEELDHYVG